MFALPALYSTLSIMWVANIDCSSVQLTQTYTYLQTINEAITEAGRSCYNVIGDFTNRSRIQKFSLMNTLVSILVIMSFIIVIVISGARVSFVDNFTNGSAHSTAVVYVVIAAWAMFMNTISTLISGCLRSMGYFNLTMYASIIKKSLNIFLDFALISKVRVGWITPTVVTTGWIRFGCEAVAMVFILLVTLLEQWRELKKRDGGSSSTSSEVARGAVEWKLLTPSYRNIHVLSSAPVYCFLKSAYRNMIYLILQHNIIQVRPKYVTAFGNFSTIRWGIIMVINQTFEAVFEVFIASVWGDMRKNVIFEDAKGHSRSKNG